MYSLYAGGQFSPIEEPKYTTGTPPRVSRPSRQETIRDNALLSELTGGISQIFGRIGKQFTLDRFDAGDILLVLIILFLFLEGDNLDVVITLGLIFLLGLHDD